MKTYVYKKKKKLVSECSQQHYPKQSKSVNPNVPQLVMDK